MPKHITVNGVDDTLSALWLRIPGAMAAYGMPQINRTELLKRALLAYLRELNESAEHDGREFPIRAEMFE